VAFAGFSGATFTNATNAAAVFVPFQPFDERVKQGLSADKIIKDLFARMQVIEEAFIIAIPPPPVRGIGNSGGFKMQVQERLGPEVGRILSRCLAKRIEQRVGFGGEPSLACSERDVAAEEGAGLLANRLGDVRGERVDRDEGRDA